MWTCAECSEENKDEYKLCQYCGSNEAALLSSENEEADDEQEASGEPLRVEIERHQVRPVDFTKMPPTGVKLRNFSYAIIIIFIVLGVILFAVGMEAGMSAPLLLGIIAGGGVNIWVLCIVLSGIAEIIRNTNTTKMIALWNFREKQHKDENK